MFREHRLRDLLFCWITVLALTFITACGGGGGDSSQQPAGSVRNLIGDPASKAIDHTVNLNIITGTAAQDIETDPTSGIEFAITSFQIRLVEDVTVGEVNDLLSSLDGELVSMFEGAPFLMIRIPNPGGLTEYNQIISDLRSNPLIAHVSPGYFPAIRELPSNHILGDGNTNMVSHHLAVGAHAAWHVRYLADMSLLPPHLIIADAFGDGNPDAAFNIASMDTSLNTRDPYNHGYGVLGVILSKYMGGSSPRGLQTGMYPSSLSVTAIDMTEWPVGYPRLTSDEVEDLIIHSVKDQSGRPAIVNTSIGFPCISDVEASRYCVDSWAREEGFDWLQKVRLNGLEDSFVHITAAGNISSAAASNTQAMYDSTFAAARLIVDFELADGTLISPLDNTLVVESLAHTVSAPYQPVCLSSVSKYHGDIAAIGHSVSSLTANSDPAGVKFYSGTSFAAPQVAGIAAYVWALDPTLTAMSVIERLKKTTRASVSDAAAGNTVSDFADQTADPNSPPNCTSTLSARVVDAYSAILSTDVALTPALAPVRRELMDVADSTGAPGRNGQFDEHDIQLLLDMHALQDGELDYSRYDLNGDGYTGGSETERFDLDLDAAFGIVSRLIDSETIDFDESSLTDQSILCYFGFSDLYQGDETIRDEHLIGQCTSRVELTLYMGKIEGIFSGLSSDYYLYTRAFAFDEVIAEDFYMYSPATDIEWLSFDETSCRFLGGDTITAGGSEHYQADRLAVAGMSVASAGLTAQLDSSGKSGSLVASLSAIAVNKGRVTIPGGVSDRRGWTTVSMSTRGRATLLLDNQSDSDVDLHVSWSLSNAYTSTGDVYWLDVKSSSGFLFDYINSGEIYNLFPTSCNPGVLTDDSPGFAPPNSDADSSYVGATSVGLGHWSYDNLPSDSDSATESAWIRLSPGLHFVPLSISGHIEALYDGDQVGSITATGSVDVSFQVLPALP